MRGLAADWPRAERREGLIHVEVDTLKLTYLESGSSECPLLLLSGTDRSALAEFKAALGTLASGAADSVALDTVAGVEASGGIGLRAVQRGKGSGVRQVSEGSFEWVGDQERWAEICELIDPFLGDKPSSGFQYLETHGSITVILSPGGKW